ncbi:MAG TPA: hypothetical protein VGL94_17005 [Ktedonobacteraceae bacterium]|jgi:hypothetical protein
MLEIVGTSESLPVVSLLLDDGPLDFSCLDGCVTSHPQFTSGYRCGYAVYFDVESADPGDIVYGVPVTSLGVIESTCRSMLGTNYREATDLFFWSVGTCAGFLTALASYHAKEAQAGFVVLTALSRVIFSEVLAC